VIGRVENRRLRIEYMKPPLERQCGVRGHYFTYAAGVHGRDETSAAQFECGAPRAPFDLLGFAIADLRPPSGEIGEEEVDALIRLEVAVNARSCVDRNRFVRREPPLARENDEVVAHTS
jgi:hypothetical protein